MGIITFWLLTICAGFVPRALTCICNTGSLLYVRQRWTDLEILQNSSLVDDLLNPLGLLSLHVQQRMLCFFKDVVIKKFSLPLGHGEHQKGTLNWQGHTRPFSERWKVRSWRRKDLARDMRLDVDTALGVLWACKARTKCAASLPSL